MKSVFLRTLSLFTCLLICTLALTSCDLVDSILNFSSKETVPDDIVYEFSTVNNITITQNGDSVETLDDLDAEHEMLKKAFRSMISNNFCIYSRMSDTSFNATMIPDTLTCKDGKISLEHFIGIGDYMFYNQSRAYMEYESEVLDFGTYSGKNIAITLENDLAKDFKEAYVENGRFIIHAELVDDEATYEYDIVFEPRA